MSNDIGSVLAAYPYMTFSRQWDVRDLQFALGECSAIVDAIGHAPLLPQYRDQLHLLSLRKGAQATTAIEGNTLSDEEVERVAKGQELPASKEYQRQEVQNIIDAFNNLLEEIALYKQHELISPVLLQRLHKMVGKDLGERFRAVPGAFASTQRVVGPYRAPQPDDVVPLLTRLCEWLREEFHFPNQQFPDAIIQAIVTHLYIEWIHPFDDGNGRTGRLVEFYILTRAGLPSVASHILANFYNETRSEYYRQLQIAKQERSLTRFLTYAVIGLRDGLHEALKTVQKNAREQMWRVLVYDKFGRGTTERRGAFKRQRLVALTLPLDREIRFSEIQNLSPDLLMAYSKVGERTVMRDLNVLEKLGLIIRSPGLVAANVQILNSTFAVRPDSVLAKPLAN